MTDPEKPNGFRRLRPHKAVKLAPFYFAAMFVASAAFDAIFDGVVDWSGSLLKAVLFAFALTLGLMAFKLTPKFP